MISAFPVRLEVPGEDGGSVREEGRLEIALETVPAIGPMAGAAYVRLIVWAESGRYAFCLAGPAALSAAGALSSILAALFPDNVSRERSDLADEDR